MFITVLTTTTYNRAYRLPDLYNSLKRQSDKNFEWIIIDDGSTDETKDMVKSLVEAPNGFEIVYKYVENGGKHRGLNYGESIARGNVFINVDSDDYLMDDAIEFINTHFPEIEDDDSFAGIGCLMCYKDGSVVGGKPSFGEFVDEDVYVFNTRIHPGDKVEVFKLDVLKRYPYPEFQGEKFLCEGTAIYNMAYDGLKMRWFNKPLTCVEYLPDGLSKNVFLNSCNNPRGWAAYHITLNRLGNTISNAAKAKYWLVMRNKLSKKELFDALQLNDCDKTLFLKDLDVLDNAITDAVSINATLALYGYGSNARFFKRYLEEKNIRIEYVIDKNSDEVEFEPSYRIEDTLPEVDIIIITLGGKNAVYIDAVEKQITTKLPNCKVLALSRIGTSFFN